jgi:alpha-N-arabinofuranosidase
MKMYTVHHDAQLIPVKLETPYYTYGEEKLPAISVSASRNEAGKVNISLVNIDSKKSNSVKINLADMNLKNFKASILTSQKLQDHNTFDKPNKIQPKDFKDFKLKKGILEVNLPPFSVVVLESIK